MAFVSYHPRPYHCPLEILDTLPFSHYILAVSKMAAEPQPDRDAPSNKENEHVSVSTMMAVFVSSRPPRDALIEADEVCHEQFMGLSYVPAVGTGLLLPTGILHHIGEALGDTQNNLWIPGGWSVASAVSFSISGRLSDIFGRRWVLIWGQVLTLIGSVSA